MSNAVWVYFRPGFNPPQSIQEFLDWVDEHDVKVVLLHLDGRKYAHGLVVEPKIQEFIVGCTNHRLQVHGLFNALTSVPEDWINQQHKDLFCVDYHGISVLDEPISGRRLFMDPHKPDVVRLLKTVSSNILQSYPGLSGIQLDFLRYYHWESSFTINAREMGHNVSFFKHGNPLQLAVDDQKVSYFLKESKVLYDDPPIGDEFTFYHNFSYCFCNYCLEGFSSKYHVAIPTTLEKTTEIAEWIYGNAEEQWYDYRCDILESAIRQIHQAVKAVDSSKHLSITVWYNSPYGNELVDTIADFNSVVRGFGQNWWDWAERGFIDFVCTMNYWLKAESFGKVIKEQLAKVDGIISLYSGLLRSDEYRVDSTELRRYEAFAKEAKAEGICFFHYGTWKDVKRNKIRNGLC